MKSNILGSIYYTPSEEYQLSGDLFNKKLNEGCFHIVYDIGDYVIKVYKHGYIIPKEYQRTVDRELKRNTIECFEPMTYIGSVKHLLGDIYHPVFKQRKLQPLSYNIKYDLDFTNKMIEAGWEPQLFVFRRGNDEVSDLRKDNFALDEEGNLKLIDCEIEKADV